MTNRTAPAALVLTYFRSVTANGGEIRFMSKIDAEAFAVGGGRVETVTASYSVGDKVQAYAFGAWRDGVVTKLGRTRVTVNFTRNRSGDQAERAFTATDLEPAPRVPVKAAEPAPAEAEVQDETEIGEGGGEVTEVVTTPELATGDLVLNHGMRIRLGERHERPAHIDPSGVVWFPGHVENYDEIKARPGGHVTDGLLRSDREWTVQGNGLAYWTRVVQG
jgi:hypothetical protein